MFRWHRPTCRKPNICTPDGMPYCSSCDAIAEFPKSRGQDLSPSPLPSSKSSRSLNLHWPSSVQYTINGEETGENSQDIHTSKRPRPEFTKGFQEGFDNLSSFDMSHYPPLRQKYDFRLLILSPLSSGGYLHGEMHLLDLIDCPAFEALSYTWAGENGDNTKSRCIFIGTFWDMIPISENCESALKLLLSKNHMNIWVDSICINQESSHERSHQVSIMRDIYSKASSVLVYLGSAAGYSDEAMDALNYFSEAETEDSEFTLQSVHKLGLTGIFQRRYFFRVWIIQEIAMARNVILYCGDKSVCWTKQTSLRMPHRYIREVPWFLKYGHGSTSTMTPPEGLLHLLNTATGCAASDPRDHVFALLGLIRDAILEGLVADYTLSKEQVYTGIAAYLIIRHNLTGILSYPKLRSPFLPTWIPDWSACQRSTVSVRSTSYPLSEDVHYNREELVELTDHLATEPVPSSGNHIDCFRLNISDTAIDRGEFPDTIWLNGDQTMWTLFTMNEKHTPRIRHLSQLWSQSNYTPSRSQPSIDAKTASLDIRGHNIINLDSFREDSPWEVTQTRTFPGTQSEFQWVVKTENCVISELDVVAYIPGCSSYLHLREDPEGCGYTLLGGCALGFRQGVMKTVQWDLDIMKFNALSLLDTNAIPAVHVSRTISEMNLTCASYGVDRSFLEFQVEILKSNLGKALVYCLKGLGELVGDLQTDALDEYLDLRMSDFSIWRTDQGWKTVMNATPGNHAIKSMCSVAVTQLCFWSQSRTWQVLDSILAYIQIYGELRQDWLDWVRVGKTIASIHDQVCSGAICTHTPATLLNGLKDRKFVHDLEAECSRRFPITVNSATMSSLVFAWKTLMRKLSRKLQLTSDILNTFLMEKELEQDMVRETSRKWGEEPELNSTERCWLGQVYADVAGENNGYYQDIVIETGIEAFESKVKARTAFFEHLHPSCLSFQLCGLEFRQTCQHIAALDEFLSGIKMERFTII